MGNVYFLHPVNDYTATAFR